LFFVCLCVLCLLPPWRNKVYIIAFAALTTPNLVANESWS